MLPLLKDEGAEVQVDIWREAAKATVESIRAAMLTNLAVKESRKVSIFRSDRFALYVTKWRSGYLMRALNYDEQNVVRRAWSAAPPSYQGGAGFGYFEMIFQPKESKFFSLNDTLAIMAAFVEGGLGGCPHKWIPEHSE